MPFVDPADMRSNERLPGWKGRFFDSDNMCVAEPGCAVIVPPNTPHSARAFGACRAILVDYPLRSDIGGGRTDD